MRIATFIEAAMRARRRPVSCLGMQPSSPSCGQVSALASQAGERLVEVGEVPPEAPVGAGGRQPPPPSTRSPEEEALGGAAEPPQHESACWQLVVPRSPIPVSVDGLMG